MMPSGIRPEPSPSVSSIASSFCRCGWSGLRRVGDEGVLGGGRRGLSGADRDLVPRVRVPPSPAASGFEVLKSEAPDGGPMVQGVSRPEGAVVRSAARWRVSGPCRTRCHELDREAGRRAVISESSVTRQQPLAPSGKIPPTCKARVVGSNPAGGSVSSGCFSDAGPAGPPLPPAS